MTRSHKFGANTRALRYTLAPDPASYRLHAVVATVPPPRGRNRNYGDRRPREPSEIVPRRWMGRR